MLELIKVFTAYIQMTTGMPAIEPPVIQQWTHCAIAGEPDGCDLTGKQHAGAMYIIPTNTIILPDDFTTDDVLDVSMLLHELVHAQQQHDPLHYMDSCIQRELQAYWVQFKWLEDVAKVNPTDAVGWERPMDGAIASCGLTAPTGLQAQ